MNSKQIWVTILISLAVALVASVIVATSVVNLQLGPLSGGGGPEDLDGIPAAPEDYLRKDCIFSDTNEEFHWDICDCPEGYVVTGWYLSYFDEQDDLTEPFAGHAIYTLPNDDIGIKFLHDYAEGYHEETVPAGVYCIKY